MRLSKVQKYIDQARYLAIAQPNKVLFEHVPKCGGTTITYYLKSQYLNNTIFSIDGSNPSKSIDYYMSLPEKKRYSYNLVHGHGAHRLRQYTHPAIKKATVLREPVDRIVSHYYYVLRTPSHYLYNDIVGKRMSLIDYATSNLSGELRNNYVSRFLQLPAKEAERDPDKSIMGAYNILKDDYSVVGTLDNLNSAMHSLARIATFRNEFKVTKLNETVDRPRLMEIDQITLNTIAEVNHLDVSLFELVKTNLAKN